MGAESSVKWVKLRESKAVTYYTVTNYQTFIITSTLWVIQVLPARWAVTTTLLTVAGQDCKQTARFSAAFDHLGAGYHSLEQPIIRWKSEQLTTEKSFNVGLQNTR